MLRYKTKTRPGLVALYDIRPGNGAGPFLQPRSPHRVWGQNRPIKDASLLGVLAPSLMSLDQTVQTYTGWVPTIVRYGRLIKTFSSAYFVDQVKSGCCLSYGIVLYRAQMRNEMHAFDKSLSLFNVTCPASQHMSHWWFTKWKRKDIQPTLLLYASKSPTYLSMHVRAHKEGSQRH